MASRNLNKGKLDIVQEEDPIALDDYTNNSVWDIIDTSTEERINEAKSKFYYYDQFEQFYYNITIKRLPLYFMMNNVYPFLVLNIVTLANYFLPFSSQTTLSKIY